MSKKFWEHEVGTVITLGQLVKYGEQQHGGVDPYEFIQEDWRVAEVLADINFDNTDEHDPLSTKFANLCVLVETDEDGNFDGYLEVWGLEQTGGGLELWVERIL